MSYSTESRAFFILYFGNRCNYFGYPKAIRRVTNNQQIESIKHYIVILGLMAVPQNPHF